MQKQVRLQKHKLPKREEYKAACFQFFAVISETALRYSFTVVFWKDRIKNNSMDKYWYSILTEAILLNYENS